MKRVADAQRLALIALLAGILAVPLSLAFAGVARDPADASPGLAGAVLLVLLVWGTRLWMAVAVYRLARALDSSVAWLWAIGAFLPNLVGLIVLAVISSRATRHLKRAGLKVGLLGAKLSERPPPGFLCEELAREFS